LETIALGSRSEGQAAARTAYVAYFTAFPDLTPDDRGMAGENVMVTWGFLNGTSGGDWLGVPPTGQSFAVLFTNVATFADDLMVGEGIYFDLATLCEQAALPFDAVRLAAKDRDQARSEYADRTVCSDRSDLTICARKGSPMSKCSVTLAAMIGLYGARRICASQGETEAGSTELR
jgi:predicted ester cyclase